MGDRPLAARFDEGDSAGLLAGYLDAQATTAFWRERKAESIALLDPREGAIVLDVGCGTGDDVRALGRTVGASGRAVGLDASRELVAEARRRSSSGEPVEFVHGDAGALPFEDGRFDAVRAERVLQHLPDPAAAVAELARVARAGGAVVAIEPDWATLAIVSGSPATSLAVCRAWAQAIRQPRAGRSLEQWFAAAGLGAIRVSESTWEIDSLALAREQFGLEALLNGLTERDEVAADAAAAWMAELEERSASGSFAACVTYTTVVATVAPAATAAPAAPAARGRHRRR